MKKTEVETEKKTKKKKLTIEPETVEQEPINEESSKNERFNSTIIKRVFAYMIDFVIIVVITSLLSGVKALNPKYEEYQAAYTEYMEMYNEIIQSSNSSYTITPQMESVMYDVARYSISMSIIELSVIVLYFTMFPFLFQGQTIGKKLLKIRIVHKDEGKKPGFVNYLLRAILYPLFTSGIFYCAVTLTLNILGLVIFKQTHFVNINKTVLMIGIVWGYIDTFSCVFRKDGRPLHDLIANTKIEYIKKEN